MPALAAMRRRLAGEAGFGLVEVLTAALVLGVGLVGAMAALDGANRGAYEAQRHEQAVSLAQREVERLQALAFNRLELDAYPQTSADTSTNPDDPRAYVSGGDLLIRTNYHDRNSPPPDELASAGRDREPFVVDSDVSDDPVSVPPLTAGVHLAPVSSSGAQATADVHRFITRRDQSCAVAGIALTDLCPDEEGARRIVVAVTHDDSTGTPRKPVYVTGVVTDPDAAPLDLP